MRITKWSLLAAARATENQLWVVGANSAGVSNDMVMGGHSVIVDPWGEVTAELTQAGVISADLDPDLPHRVRAEFPVLRDRRL
ncbi:MAG: nitrilase-related carbon-nitrogen hydrolase [Candidatus Nanopelagicales bacterium]